MRCFCINILISKVFLRHGIDGASLLLLSESHLMDKLGLKVGPAVRLRAALAKKLSR